MIIGPKQASISAASVSGVITVDSVSGLVEGAVVYLNGPGVDSRRCTITDIWPATYELGLRFIDVDQPSYGRDDVSLYNGGTIDMPRQEYKSQDANAIGETRFLESVSVEGNLRQQGGVFFPPQYATGDIPSAAANEGGIVYDITTQRMKFSDGSAWKVIAFI